MIINNQSIYLFVNKNYEEMNEIFSKPNTPIIKSNDEVKVLKKSLKTYQKFKEESIAKK